MPVDPNNLLHSCHQQDYEENLQKLLMSQWLRHFQDQKFPGQQQLSMKEEIAISGTFLPSKFIRNFQSNFVGFVIIVKA
jgi:hypothetical protein